MAARGTKPKPTAVKKLAGNPGGRPLSETEAQPGPASYYSPRILTSGGRDFWKRLAREMIDLGVLTAWDVPAFVMMATLSPAGSGCIANAMA